MKPMRKEPYFSYALKRLPRNSALEQAIAEYLGMRLHKVPELNPRIWESCIDELVRGMNIKVEENPGKKKQRIIGKKEVDGTHLINDLIYLFNVATHRGWNHVYFTQEQDADWNNMAFYQDPYWSRAVNDRKIRKKLEVILDGKSN